MAMTIKPHTGTRENPLTGKSEEMDLGLDVIVCEEAGRSFDVGFVARIPNAPLSIIRPISDSQLKEAEKAVAARECEKETKPDSKRAVTQVGRVGDA